jgi:hypothetical protein
MKAVVGIATLKCTPVLQILKCATNCFFNTNSKSARAFGDPYRVEHSMKILKLAITVAALLILKFPSFTIPYDMLVLLESLLLPPPPRPFSPTPFDYF